MSVCVSLPLYTHLWSLGYTHLRKKGERAKHSTLEHTERKNNLPHSPVQLDVCVSLRVTSTTATQLEDQVAQIKQKLHSPARENTLSLFFFFFLFLFFTVFSLISLATEGAKKQSLLTFTRILYRSRSKSSPPSFFSLPSLFLLLLFGVSRWISSQLQVTTGPFTHSLNTHITRLLFAYSAFSLFSTHMANWLAKWSLDNKLSLSLSLSPLA